MDLFSLPKHPAADLYPFMPSAEMSALIEDIKANGLREPIVLFNTGRKFWLLDGRSRRYACMRANVKPTFTVWKGDDPIAYVVEANSRTKRLDSKQQAFVKIAVDKLYADAEKKNDRRRRRANGVRAKVNKPSKGVKGGSTPKAEVVGAATVSEGKDHPMEIEPFYIEELRMDGGTQPRTSADQQMVDDYADAMQRGDVFPPVVVFHDGTHAWLADGFHRVLAAKKLDQPTVLAEVRNGTLRDAILFAVGANATHGKPRTNADKRHAVTLLLRDEEWSAWSDREIARRCAVDHAIVGRIRHSISGDEHQMPIHPQRKARRGGTEYTVTTEGISNSNRGRKGAASPIPAASPEEPVLRPEPSFEEEAHPEPPAAHDGDNEAFDPFEGLGLAPISEEVEVEASPLSDMNDSASSSSATIADEVEAAWAYVARLSREALIALNRRIANFLQNAA